MTEIVLSVDQANRRLDRVLQAYLNEAPKNLIHKLLRKKRIKLNGKNAHGGELTAVGDVLRFYMAVETIAGLRSDKAAHAVAKPLDVVYEDKHVLIVNKPQGLLTHSDKPGVQDTLIARVLHHVGGDFRPALVNRLDRNTSGLVMAGKTMAGLQALNACMAARGVIKTYLAVVHGKLAGSGTLRGHLVKDSVQNRAAIVSGRANVRTDYKAIRHVNDLTLLELVLHTGKSHQIRAQLSDIGHPIVGDVKYGGGRGGGQLLHACSLEFVDCSPPIEYLKGQVFQAPVPEGFNVFRENESLCQQP